MNSTLTCAIREAQHRLRGVPLTTEEATNSIHAQELDEFKRLIASKLDMKVQIELLLPYDLNPQDGYFWSDIGPAMRFRVDNRTFLLVLRGRECELQLEEDKQLTQLARLQAEDDLFQDKLLCALGDVLLPRATVIGRLVQFPPTAPKTPENTAR